MACALLVALGFVGWTFGSQFARVSRELDQTKRRLSAANEEVARIRKTFAEASVIHNLWGLGAEFGESGSAACSPGEAGAAVRARTAAAIELWSDSAARSEINLERSLLPVLRGLRQQGFRVVGMSLPAGVVGQYRRFRREKVGDVIMIDPSRVVDAASRAALLELLRRAGEGQLDPEQTYVLYRFDQYGKVSYPLIQGPSDASLLKAKLSPEPLADPVTVAASDYPCS
jgi:hypothetical protein